MPRQTSLCLDMMPSMVIGFLRSCAPFAVRAPIPQEQQVGAASKTPQRCRSPSSCDSTPPAKRSRLGDVDHGPPVAGLLSPVSEPEHSSSALPSTSWPGGGAESKDLMQALDQVEADDKLEFSDDVDMSRPPAATEEVIVIDGDDDGEAALGDIDMQPTGEEPALVAPHGNADPLQVEEVEAAPASAEEAISAEDGHAVTAAREATELPVDESVVELLEEEEDVAQDEEMAASPAEVVCPAEGSVPDAAGPPGDEPAFSPVPDVQLSALPDAKMIEDEGPRRCEDLLAPEPLPDPTGLSEKAMTAVYTAEATQALSMYRQEAAACLSDYSRASRQVWTASSTLSSTSSASSLLSRVDSHLLPLSGTSVPTVSRKENVQLAGMQCDVMSCACSKLLIEFAARSLVELASASSCGRVLVLLPVSRLPLWYAVGSTVLERQGVANVKLLPQSSQCAPSELVHAASSPGVYLAIDGAAAGRGAAVSKGRGSSFGLPAAPPLSHRSGSGSSSRGGAGGGRRKGRCLADDDDSANEDHVGRTSCSTAKSRSGSRHSEMHHRKWSLVVLDTLRCGASQVSQAAAVTTARDTLGDSRPGKWLVLRHVKPDERVGGA
mmetsp:Transcript_62640/g.149410  ORF Transcript_62640/g.149410 Transcript_62640/m.149410 type:complete len:608 (-) Transcript_62640:98-1921(-)